jgi:hypothetical protein
VAKYLEVEHEMVWDEENFEFLGSICWGFCAVVLWEGEPMA